MLGAVAAAGSVAIPGCSLPFVGGCGPGEDGVSDLQDAVESGARTDNGLVAFRASVGLKGEVRDVLRDDGRPVTFVLDDGTGNALVGLGDLEVSADRRPVNVEPTRRERSEWASLLEGLSEGDCVEVVGDVPPPWRAGVADSVREDYDADAWVAVTALPDEVEEA